MGLRARFLMPNRVGEGAAETYIEKVLGYSPIAYWPLNEASGSDAICQVDSPAQDGAYTGVTLGETGIGDGETCPFFDGVNDYTNIYSATFAAAFSPTAGTIFLWVKVANAAVWTDAAARMNIVLRADSGNNIEIGKYFTSDEVWWKYKAGGTVNEIFKAVTPLTWFNLGLTWDKTADEVKAYYNGSQEGATQTGLGTWAGALASTLTIIGAGSTTPTYPTNGYLAHCAVWDTALTPSEILDLATI